MIDPLMMPSINIQLRTEGQDIFHIFGTTIDERPLIPVVRMSIKIAFNKILMDFRTDHLLQKTQMG